MQMQHRGLRTFCAAAEHLSFKKAADELCITASAVSHQISDLESQLGTKLFQRLTRSVSLTTEGSHLFEEISPCLQAIDHALDTVKKNSTKAQLLIQMPEFFASELLIPHIGEFSEQYTDIDLRIESMESSDSINPAADINIVLSRKRPSGNNVKKLFPISYIPTCSRRQFDAWARKGITAAEGIRSSTVLLHKARPNAWRQWAKLAGLPELKSKQIIFVDTMFSLARATEKGVGVALVPMPVSKAWFDSGSLVPLHSTHLLTKDFYWMVLKEDAAETKSSQLLWNWVSDLFQGIDEKYSSVTI
ncbi:MAG: LysR family glycine cleavage system transcriptional activator [Pseudohongiellaceae bacterium]|jgi:LysR family glycine cleavage system transcriptional activator